MVCSLYISITGDKREKEGDNKMYVLHSLVGGEVGEGLQSQKHIDVHLTVVSHNENCQFNLMCPASGT